MRFLLIGLVFYLLVTGYFAVRRVIRKRQLAKDSAQNNAAQNNAAQNNAAQNNAAQNISQASFSPATENAPKPSEPTAPDLSDPAIVIGESSDQTIGSPIVFEPEADLNLAVSLAVSEVVHPEPSTVEVPDLIPTDPEITEVLNANSEQQPIPRPSILEEIAELRPMADVNRSQAETPTHRFMHLLQTGDGTTRVAAVYELGRIAAQRHDSETDTIIEQLQFLTQDDDPDVRLQAIAALEKVQQSE